MLHVPRLSKSPSIRRDTIFGENTRNIICHWITTWHEWWTALNVAYYCDVDRHRFCLNHLEQELKEYLDGFVFHLWIQLLVQDHGINPYWRNYSYRSNVFSLSHNWLEVMWDLYQDIYWLEYTFPEQYKLTQLFDNGHFDGLQMNSMDVMGVEKLGNVYQIRLDNWQKTNMMLIHGG